MFVTDIMVEPVFAPLSGEADGASPTVVDSMCVNCGEDGLTRLLLTKIPHYQEVILMSFRCEHCHYTNNEIQPGGRIQDKGVRWVAHFLCQRCFQLPAVPGTR